MKYILRFVLLSLVFTVPIIAAEPNTKKPKAPDPAEPQTLMAARGKLLMYEPFDGPGWTNNLSPYKGDFQLIDGHLKAATVAGAGHPPQLSHYAPITNVVVQVRLRLDGAKRASVQLSSPERKENIAVVSLSPTEISIDRMSGWGGTTKVVRVTAKPLNVDKDHWYTLLVEWCDDACLVRIDDHLLLYGEAKEFAVTKGQFALQSSGDGAWYDDVRLWDAVTDPTWAKRKADVVALAAKSH